MLLDCRPKHLEAKKSNSQWRDFSLFSLGKNIELQISISNSKQNLKVTMSVFGQVSISHLVVSHGEIQGENHICTNFQRHVLFAPLLLKLQAQYIYWDSKTIAITQLWFSTCVLVYFNFCGLLRKAELYMMPKLYIPSTLNTDLGPELVRQDENFKSWIA